MEQLSLSSYVWKCVLGSEIVYSVCLIGGYLPWRTQRGIELHHAIFETIPGFIWGSFGSAIWGAVLVVILAVIVGSYIVWMHNSSMRAK